MVSAATTTSAGGYPLAACPPFDGRQQPAATHGQHVCRLAANSLVHTTAPTDAVDSADPQRAFSRWVGADSAPDQRPVSAGPAPRTGPGIRPTWCVGPSTPGTSSE